jgi:predicted hydrocarbon binding protein
MPGKIDRIYRNIEESAGSDVSKTLRENCGETDIKAIMSELERTCDEETVARIMKSCGRQCIPKSYLSRAISIYKESDGIEDFLVNLNETRIGGGQLHLRDGKIIGIYDQCYCGLVKKLKELSPLYCHCSAGWYEQLFSSVLKKAVEVEKIATIPDGADHCEFEISFQ